MRDDLVGGVELLTGRKVVSFLSDHDSAADMAAEVFVLVGPPQAGTFPPRLTTPRPAANRRGGADFVYGTIDTETVPRSPIDALTTSPGPTATCVTEPAMMRSPGSSR